MRIRIVEQHVMVTIMEKKKNQVLTFRSFPLDSQQLTIGRVDSTNTLNRFFIVSRLSSSLPFHNQDITLVNDYIIYRTGTRYHFTVKTPTWFLFIMRLSSSSSGQSKNRTKAGLNLAQSIPKKVLLNQGSCVKKKKQNKAAYSIPQKVLLNQRLQYVKIIDLKRL